MVALTVDRIFSWVPIVGIRSQTCNKLWKTKIQINKKKFFKKNKTWVKIYFGIWETQFLTLANDITPEHDGYEMLSAVFHLISGVRNLFNHAVCRSCDQWGNSWPEWHRKNLRKRSQQFIDLSSFKRHSQHSCRWIPLRNLITCIWENFQRWNAKNNKKR